MSRSTGRYETFVVRIWSRAGEMVHGQVIDITTRETRYFRNPGQLVALLLRRFGGPPKPLPRAVGPPPTEP